MSVQNGNESCIDPPAIAAGSVEVVDVVSEKPAARRTVGWRLFVGMILVGVPAGIIAVFTAAMRLAPPIRVVIAACAIGLILLVVRRVTEPARETLLRTIERLGVKRAIDDAMATPWVMDSYRGVSLMLAAAAQRGHRGVLYRFLPRAELEELSPIGVPFEPTVLDERDSRVADLMTTSSPDAPQKPGSATSRSIRRAGGWAIVIIFGFNVVIHAIRSIATRQVTWELIWWAGILAVMLFGVGRSWREPTFLAVPGGIISRKLKGIQRDPQVHLFVARESILCVYRATRLLWVVAVADQHDAKWAAVTPTEARFAMAAWLSPLDPPTPEQLSEL